jgi:NADPH2:quinone reductase
VRAAVCQRLDSDRSGLVFEADWPDASLPAPGEVRVKLHYAALNYPDLLMLQGGYQYKPTLPFIPGVEGCGMIAAVGEGVTSALVGTMVVVGARSGCFAEYVTVPVDAVRPVPDGLPGREAAAHTVGALTAYVALVHRGRLQPGERVLVTGAGGGTGLAAVATAAALGATVVAAASSTEKLTASKRAGASELLLIDRTTSDYSGLAEPVDVIFDPVGSSDANASAVLLRTLRWGGRYLIIGFVSGVPVVPLNRLLLKGIEVIGVRAGEFGRRHPAAGLANLAAIDALAAAGKLRPYLGLAVSLAEVERAFAAMAEGTLVGKAVVNCR